MWLPLATKKASERASGKPAGFAVHAVCDLAPVGVSVKRGLEVCAGGVAQMQRRKCAKARAPRAQERTKTRGRVLKMLGGVGDAERVAQKRQAPLLR